MGQELLLKSHQPFVSVDIEGTLVPSLTIINNGTYGRLGVSQTFLLYNSTAVGTISARDINDRSFVVDSIVDAFHYSRCH